MATDEQIKHAWAGKCTCTPLRDGSLRRDPSCPIHGKLHGDVIDRESAGGGNPTGWNKAERAIAEAVELGLLTEAEAEAQAVEHGLLTQAQADELARERARDARR